VGITIQKEAGGASSSRKGWGSGNAEKRKYPRGESKRIGKRSSREKSRSHPAGRRAGTESAAETSWGGTNNGEERKEGGERKGKEGVPKRDVVCTPVAEGNSPSWANKSRGGNNLFIIGKQILRNLGLTQFCRSARGTRDGLLFSET